MVNAAETNEHFTDSGDHSPDSKRDSKLPCKLDVPRKLDVIDRCVCHPILGYVLFAVIMFCAFQLTFSLADGWYWVPSYTQNESGLWYWELSTPVNFVRTLFDVWLPAMLEPRLPWSENSAVHSLIYDGIISGVGSVVMFVPVIFIMFLVLSFLDQTGYIARVALIMDRLMRLFGLQGQSVMPMILAGGICGGCAVPAIMATRSMTDRRERILTILILPMMNCGAKMPVYLLLVGTFFAAWKGLMMASLVFVSWGIALTCAKFLSHTVVCGRCTCVPTELPPWKRPHLSLIAKTAVMQSWAFLQKAGTIILLINVLLWCLMYYPRPDGNDVLYHYQLSFPERASVYPTGKRTPTEHCAGFSNGFGIPDNRDRLAGSYAGRIGRTLVPVSRFAGFDWRDNVALIGGFAAKEVIVSSLGTLHKVEPDIKHETHEMSENHAPVIHNSKEFKRRMIGEKLSSEPGWNGIKAFAMILFVMIYSPCAATCVVIYRETRQLRWVAISVGFNTVVAFLLAVIVYQVGGWLFP